MYFLFRKDNGHISLPVKFGEPGQRTLDKELNCELGSGIKWGNVNVFYAPDDEFPEDFQRWAATGKYYVDGDEITENLDWEVPIEEEP